MIYITPTSSLVSQKSQERATQFAKKIGMSEESLAAWVDSIIEQSESIKNVEDVIRVSCIHNISLKEGKNEAWGEAALLHKAFNIKNHSCQFGVEIGIKCPYDVERLYRAQDSRLPSGTKLKNAISEYNHQNSEPFELDSQCIVNMRLRGFMERPLLSASPDAVEMQKKRLLDNFKIHVQSKVEQQVLSLLPTSTLENNKRRTSKKQNDDFSLNM